VLLLNYYGAKMSVQEYFIKSQYFVDNASFVKMLDPGNIAKQAQRAYICVKVSLDGNDYYIPLRNHLGDAERLFGRIGHAVPSHKRPKAGLDYRYALIVNDANQIETPLAPTIPNSQSTILTNDYSDIEKEFATYLNGFKKALRKNRVSREPLYKESSLINFASILLPAEGKSEGNQNT